MTGFRIGVAWMVMGILMAAAFCRPPAVVAEEGVPLNMLTSQLGVLPDSYTVQDVSVGGSFWAAIDRKEPLAALGFAGMGKGDRIYFNRIAADRWLLYAPRTAQRIRVMVMRHINPVVKPRLKIKTEFREEMARIGKADK